MDFQDLYLFTKLADTQNFAKTANQNHMSPSTLSRQIQRIEEEIGHRLFIRDNRQVCLTEKGEKFYQFAKNEWQNWQQFKQQLKDESDELSGELKLFCSVTASYSHLPQILKQFRQRYPKVEIQLTTGDPALAVELIQTQQTDLALAGKPNHLPASIAFHKIDDIKLSLIAPRIACLATQLLQEKPINWQQMPFIFPVEGHARQRIEQWLREKKINHPKIYATVAGHEGIVPMVGLGFGLAMLPDEVINNSPMNNQISRLNLDVPIEPFELGICTQKRHLAHPLIRAFWAMLE
ncbi:HTH-type transcriptional activator IlvY [Rodentibacter haemolyticus]|uniref:HTH-type transcriptional activator IlvY n=1 Tax=Rodentibacter haemolyticus TaxID=2778911 RepID=A0ABX6UW95_9PAST|nr:HTH-type transcriptional activator IlvY [Rodentibacter haemolyticus]QPB41714.1 HTH-type transcriptional activator IlvY [Rodentibacter haemolyticus]